MRSRDLVYVVLKLFAIYFIVKGIEYLCGGVIFWSAYLTQKAAYGDAVSTSVMIPRSLFLLQFLIAAFFFGMAHFTWIFTPKIVKYIFPTDNEIQEEKKRQIKAKDLQTAAFTVVGIVIFSHAILYLSNWIHHLIMKTTETKIKQAMMSINNSAAPFPDAVHFLTITGILIYLIIGITLIVWGKQFVRFVSQINPGAVTLAQKLRLLPKAEKPAKRDFEEIQEG